MKLENNDFNLNKIEAFKFMLDGKKVICLHGSILYYNDQLNRIEVKESDKSYSIGADDFLSHRFNYVPKFKEYIEPKKPINYQFETYIGENFGVKPFNKCPVEMAFNHHVSKFNNDYIALRAMYNHVSKVKVTIEMLE